MKAFPVFEKYKELWNFYIPENYTVTLTLYGMGGSYEYRKGNGKVILFTKEDGTFGRESPLATIIHEMVHIGIEQNIILKYDLPQPVKERIVDKFMEFHFKGNLVQGVQDAGCRGERYR